MSIAFGFINERGLLNKHISGCQLKSHPYQLLNLCFSRFSKTRQVSLPLPLSALNRQYGRTGVYGKVSDIPVLSQHFATGLRSVPRNLTAEEIGSLREDIRAIGTDESVFEFNKGSRTSFSDNHGKIYVKVDVLPDPYGYTARDKMRTRAVLAHEYYGHYRMRGTKLPKGHWADEFRASFRAAMFAPGLSDEDRQLLMRDALDRAEGGGYTIKKKKIIEIIRRYLYGSTI